MRAARVRGPWGRVVLALPLVGIALAALLLARGFSWSDTTEATAGSPISMQFRVQSGSTDCAPTAKPAKCSVRTATKFILNVAVNTWPPDPDGPGPLVQGYSAMATDIDWTGTGLTLKKRANSVEVPWPDRANLVTTNNPFSATRIRHADLSLDVGTIPSTFKGNVVSLSFNCSAGTSTNVVTLVPYDPVTNNKGTALQDAAGTVHPASDSITINCVPEPTSAMKLHVKSGCLPWPTPTPKPPTATATPPVTPTATPTATPKPPKCFVPFGGTFILSVAVNSWPPDPDGTGPLGEGYIALQTDVDWTGTSLTLKKRANSAEVVWPDRGNLVTTNNLVSSTRIQHGDLSAGAGSTLSTFKGNVVELAFNCSSGASFNDITLVPFDPLTGGGGAALFDAAGTMHPASDTFTVNCFLPTFTPTNTATHTPTRTPTPTPVPIPRMQKLPPFQNLFLTRQGTKIPPARCLDGTNVATLTESISVPISGQDPKDPAQPQRLGGFSFQVKYDLLKVCVTLRPGAAWTNTGQVCTVQDSATAPALQGIARINCVTLGKATVVDTSTAAGRTLALIEVRPQPEAYSQIRANQDNGQVVQLNNEACKLTDLQGHSIQVFSCEDADVTVRFLEGDVEPDCAVNTLDTQAIAFRWGAAKGGLVYNDRFNLEPSGTQADQDIDVSDLQFVYGRFGSNCLVPWPTQAPVKAKG